jgi:hypothetical protein
MKNLVKVVLLSLVIIFSLTLYGCHYNSPLKPLVSSGPSAADVKKILKENYPDLRFEILEEGKQMKDDGSFPFRVRTQYLKDESNRNGDCREDVYIFHFKKVQESMGNYVWVEAYSDKASLETVNCKNIIPNS